MVGSCARVVGRSGTTATIVVASEIDIATAPQLRACLTDCLAEGCTDLALDLRDLTFIDASGLSVVAYVAKLLESGGGRLTLEKPRPMVRKVLDISGLATSRSSAKPNLGRTGHERTHP